MDYDSGFRLQKTMVSSNRWVDWSLFRSSSAHLLPSGRKNPRFNRKNQRSTAEGEVKFQFENGEVLKFRLYGHLKVGGELL